MFLTVVVNCYTYWLLGTKFRSVSIDYGKHRYIILRTLSQDKLSSRSFSLYIITYIKNIFKEKIRKLFYRYKAIWNRTLFFFFFAHQIP